MGRRWQLVDRWARYGGGHSDTVIGKAWTRRGALFQHAGIKPFLRSRGGQASILLRDTKTGQDTVLSVQ
jgi:hypothetical protein